MLKLKLQLTTSCKESTLWKRFWTGKDCGTVKWDDKAMKLDDVIQPVTARRKLQTPESWALSQSEVSKWMIHKEAEMEQLVSQVKQVNQLWECGFKGLIPHQQVPGFLEECPSQKSMPFQEQKGDQRLAGQVWIWTKLKSCPLAKNGTIWCY